MKKNILIIITLVFICNTNLFSQDISTYTFGLPEVILEKDSKIFIEDFEDLATNQFSLNFNETIKEKIKGNIVNDFSSALKNQIPWAKNDNYTLVENKEEADYIINGNYTYNSGTVTTNSTRKVVILIDNTTSFTSLGLNYYTYTNSLPVNFSGIINISKKSGELVKSKEFAKSQNATKSKNFTPITAEINPQTSVEALSGNIASSSAYTQMLTPSFYPKTLELNRVKTITKEKADKKAIKAIYKEIKKLLKDNPKAIKLAGLKYLSILEIEKSPNTLYNVGLCYYAIGNYTKAKEYFDESTISEINIDLDIRNRETLRNLGIEIIENNFE